MGSEDDGERTDKLLRSLEMFRGFGSFDHIGVTVCHTRMSREIAKNFSSNAGILSRVERNGQFDDSTKAVRSSG
jgi:hypothetical protein